MTDWMPLKVLANDDVSPHGAATRRPSFTRVFGLRVLRTPFSVVHALSTLAARTTLGLPSQGRQWARNFHPVRVRFGRLTTVPQSVLTVTPLESMETRRSTDAGTFATPDCAMANWAAQVGVGTFFAVAGVAAPMARNAASHTIREERARMIPSISQSGRRGRADRVPIDTDPARPAPGILRTPSSYDRGSTERAIRAAQRSQASIGPVACPIVRHLHFGLGSRRPRRRSAGIGADPQQEDREAEREHHEDEQRQQIPADVHETRVAQDRGPEAATEVREGEQRSGVARG